LNDIDLLMYDIGNAYLNAPTTEKLYCVARNEFGPEEEGENMLIVRALYGLKSSGVAYRAHFASNRLEMGFISCKADPDVWLRPATKSNGFEYYEYILTYLDNCLILSENPRKIVQVLEQDYQYRSRDVGEPTRYLCAEVGKQVFSDGTKAYYMSAGAYLKQAISEIESKWGNLAKLFPRQQLDVPMPAGSHPELDDSKMLNDEYVQLYYVSILRWAIELGYFDLAHSAP
jgi:hypothetical protein